MRNKGINMTPVERDHIMSDAVYPERLNEY